MKYALTLCMWLLAGCGVASMSDKHWRHAEAACESHGGLRVAELTFFEWAYHCHDGTTIATLSPPTTGEG